jgi:colicin import membrane protein
LRSLPTRDSLAVARALPSPMLTNHSAGVRVESGLADAMATTKELRQRQVKRRKRQMKRAAARLKLRQNKKKGKEEARGVGTAGGWVTQPQQMEAAKKKAAAKEAKAAKAEKAAEAARKKAAAMAAEAAKMKPEATKAAKAAKAVKRKARAKAAKEAAKVCHGHSAADGGGDDDDAEAAATTGAAATRGLSASTPPCPRLAGACGPSERAPPTPRWFSNRMAVAVTADGFRIPSSFACGGCLEAEEESGGGSVVAGGGGDATVAGCVGGDAVALGGTVASDVRAGECSSVRNLVSLLCLLAPLQSRVQPALASTTGLAPSSTVCTHGVPSRS